MFATLLPVALGGAIGASLRHLALIAVPAPWGVMGINVLGSFLIGLLLAPALRLGLSPFLVTGILGGFTTFSAFSMDALRLWQAGQGGQAALYIAGSVILSLAAVAAGAALSPQGAP
jgi:CrcB protein